jgi:hypothetical protein
MLKEMAKSRIFKRKHGLLKALDNATLEIRESSLASLVQAVAQRALL